ncbi:MAG: endo-1,4-beta-xylanase [Anaerolineaceae bacterium]|nr:endo-1,4-beta-xylanase [Anaerolineaceae bacterium]MBN2678167.1 endo-1,4-beta-xylanase [Anaerolineaceae bacterium]
MQKKAQSRILWLVLGVIVIVIALFLIFKPKTDTVVEEPDMLVNPTTIPASQVVMIPVQPDIPSLYETLSDYFPVGAAIEPEQLDDGKHVYLLTRHFNGLTAENVMKSIIIQPTEGNFDWTGADRLVQFAREHDMDIHGHTLVWHNQVPDWFFNDSQGQPLTATPENKDLVLKRLETHIRALVGRYKGDIAVWDVVNEVIDPSYPDCMAHTKWFELTGTDYIYTAFRVAHEVDPEAKLIINEYSTQDPRKRTCVYNVVRDLRAAGLPVDGVGHQMHIDVENPSAESIEETILMFAELGVEQYVTELDMSIYTNDTDIYNVTNVPNEIMIQQGHRYKDVFDVFKRLAEHIQSVTFWGMADDHTWLKTYPITRINLPLPFDEKLEAKYAYWGIVNPDPSYLPMLIQKVNISQGTPVIDAKPDLLWSQQPWITINGTKALTVNFQTRWDKEYLYLFVDIKGSPEDVGKIEVFVDENKNRTKTYEGDDRHYIFQDDVCSSCENGSYRVAKDNGYQLEAALPLNLANGRGGQKVGFDIRITESSQPDTPISWNDLTNNQDTDTSQFGTLTFAVASKLTSAVQGTPVIDAEEDGIWADANEIVTDVWALGESGATAKVKTLWDDAHLYIYAVVSDTLLSDASRNDYEQDSIEVFIDQNNAKTAAYQADDAQYRISFNNLQSFNGDAKAELITSKTKIVDGGYVVELAIKFDAITPQEGALIGFDFQVNNDENGDGVRDSISKWNDPTNLSYMNTSRFGLLMFTIK